MSRWGKPTKNKRKIDPRYFLKENYDLGQHYGFRQAAQAASDWANSLQDKAVDLSRDTTYNQDQPGSSRPSWAGSLRNAMETATETALGDAIPGVRNLGLFTDSANALQHAKDGRWKEAGRNIVGAGGDIAGGGLGYGLCGGTFTGPNPFNIGCAAVGSAIGEPLAKFSYDTALKAGEAVVDTAKAGAEAVGTAHDRWSDRGFKGTMKDFGSELKDWLWEEGAQADNDMLLSESQIRRMQKLSGITPAPRRRTIMKEALDPDTMNLIMANAAALIAFLTMAELTDRYHPQFKRPEGGPLSSIGRGVKSAWQKLKSVASSKAQQGDTSLESMVSALEAAGPEAVQSAALSEEDIAKIQSEFADDQQLAAMIASLGQAPPEEYQQILSQIVEYIGSKSQ